MPLVVLMAAGGLAYANSFRGVFVFDDRLEIRDNPAIRSLWRPLEAMFGGVGLPRRPLPYLTFAVNYAWGGLDVVGFHAVNVAIHLAAAVVLYDVVRRTLESPRLSSRYGTVAGPMALAVAVLWVVHPLNTQAVTYIYQRMESMMSLCYLLTLASFVRGAVSQSPSPWLTASVAWCGTGMACKEVMVTAPVLMLLYDRTFIATDWQDIIRQRRRYYFALAATWLILVAVVRCQAARYGELESPLHTPLGYAVNQSAVILHYLRLACLPWGLCLDYDWQARTIFELLPSLAIVTAMLLAVGWAVAKRPCAGFLGIAFFLILAPSSSILPVDELAFEHRMYLPLAVISVAAVIVGHELVAAIAARKKRFRAVAPWIGGGATAVAAVALIAATWTRNTDYRSFVGMWTDVVAKAPGNAKAWKNLGLGLAEEGRFEESIVTFQKAIFLGETSSVTPAGWLAGVECNLGASLMSMGRLDEAAAAFDKAIHLNGEDCLAHVNRGIIALRLGDVDAARTCFEKAIDLRPEYAPAYVNLGIVVEPDDPDGALELYGKALLRNPDYAPALAATGRNFLRRGQPARAIEYLQRAVRTDPSLTAARRDLADASATRPEATPLPQVTNP
jgi:tetratricopeptide (TPR) repeat protein